MWARGPIVDWYEANNKDMSLKQLATLNNWSEKNLGAGTEHADLLDLMKQYGL